MNPLPHCRFYPAGLSTRRLLALTAALAALLAGCASLSEKDRLTLRDHRVPAPLYEKMARREALTLAEIADLSARKVSPAFIVRYVDESLAEYLLTTEEILQLRRDGVSNEVIDFLISTPQRNAQLPGYSPYWPAPYSRPIIIHHYHSSRRR